MSAGRPEVRLDRQLSKNPCVLGESWGVDDEGLWVDRGCKAVFEISGLQNSSGGGDGTPKCPYGAGSNACEYWQDGLRAGREDAMANMSMAYERHSDGYDSRFEPAYAKGYEAGWREAQRSRLAAASRASPPAGRVLVRRSRRCILDVATTSSS